MTYKHTIGTSSWSSSSPASRAGSTISPAFPDDVKWNNDTSRMHETFKEFFGTAVITFVTCGSVLSTGSLSIKYDMVELTSGRVFAIALANAGVSSFVDLLILINVMLCLATLTLLLLASLCVIIFFSPKLFHYIKFLLFFPFCPFFPSPPFPDHARFTTRCRHQPLASWSPPKMTTKVSGCLRVTSDVVTSIQQHPSRVPC